MNMATNNTCKRRSGYDCDFVKKPPALIQSECPVCLQILREPYQTPCCGNSFCRVCIERIKTDNKPCPTCNEVNFATFHNKGLQRTLYEFQVYCSHKQEGCEWKGELGQLDNHLNLSSQPDKQLEGCEYSEIECIYCSETIKRSNIGVHQNDLCPKRPFSCEYCHSYESHYEDVIYDHWPVCGYHPVQCPNECGTFPQRQALENHVTRECPKMVVNCTFHHVGCDVRLPRKDMPAHLNQNFSMHMSLQIASQSRFLASEVLTGLQDKIKKLESDNEDLRSQLGTVQQQIAKLQTTSIIEKPLASSVAKNPTPEFTLKFSDLQWEHTYDGQYRADCKWFSPPFYTHHRGYKLCLSMDCHLSISREREVDLNMKVVSFSLAMGLCVPSRGEFDDQLQWPFKGSLSLKLMNEEDFLNADGKKSYLSGLRTMPQFTVYNRVLTGEEYSNRVSIDQAFNDKFQLYYSYGPCAPKSKLKLPSKDVFQNDCMYFKVVNVIKKEIK